MGKKMNKRTQEAESEVDNSKENKRMKIAAKGGTSSTKQVKSQSKSESMLPVSLLCGFLGAGKTTLLKHILETKHSTGDFKCAVIVNDMAELNIDKSLIDQSSLVQSDEVIAMQNGCVCCTLKNDLVDQIVDLASKKTFDYMIIEASGVSEPSEIARMFTHEHCDEKEHEKLSLHDVARLDTCVTVVDTAEFFNNIESVKQKSQTPQPDSLAQLLVEQIEYSNVVVLNKTDLVNKEQLTEVEANVSVLSPKAKILKAQDSSIDVMQVVDTKLYDADAFKLTPLDTALEAKEPSCCAQKRAQGEAPCCKRARTVDSGVSKVLLAPKQAGGTRHAQRFGITSFVYRARRPFHPHRFHEKFVEKYFTFLSDKADEDSDGEESGKESEAEASDVENAVGALQEKLEELEAKHGDLKAKYSALKKKLKAGGKKGVAVGELSSDSEMEEEEEEEEEENEEEEAAAAAAEALRKQQEEAKEKQGRRTEQFGSLLRCKGFVWMANSHDLMGVVSQAGNVIMIDSPGQWAALDPKTWQGSEEEKLDRRKEWEEPWGDRRQDLVFIGKDLKHAAVQQLLDSCLLTDEEMGLGVDGWKATIGDIEAD